MAERLVALRGKFILSINDVPEVRELFGRFVFETVELGYNLAGGKPIAAKELIIQGT